MKRNGEKLVTDLVGQTVRLHPKPSIEGVPHFKERQRCAAVQEFPGGPRRVCWIRAAYLRDGEVFFLVEIGSWITEHDEFGGTLMEIQPSDVRECSGRK